MDGGIMNIQHRIRHFMEERGWSEYRLALECGLSQSTISNIFVRNTTPSCTTLEIICKAFGITMSQFFSENGMVELTSEQKRMFDAWKTLSAEQKEVLFRLIEVMKK